MARRHPRMHNGYYSDEEYEENPFARARSPSSTHHSDIARVPSPPALYSGYRGERTRNNQHHHQPYDDHARTSHNNARTAPSAVSLKESRLQPLSNHEPRDSVYHRASANPPPRRTSIHDSRRRPFEDRTPPRPLTPETPYTTNYNEYLLPEDDDEYPPPSNDRPQGPKRWQSARTSITRLGIADINGESWSQKLPVAIKPPKSVFLPSPHSASGVLGDQGYQYSTLQNMEFRLVKIFPERKTMIKCEIIHASFLDPPRYVAVSYAWGDAGNTRKIDLEGSLIPIGISLYGALEALRQKTEYVFVWVDSLCIDQQNSEERTQQVRLMASIYSAAESVAIWLGPEEDDSANAIDFLQAVVDQANSPEKISRLISSQVRKRDLAAVVQLFQRDYWRRLWVVQEILNARSITIYCGSTIVPWRVFETASDIFNQHRRDLDYYFPAGHRDRRSSSSSHQFNYSQVLVYQGPGSLPDLGKGSLLEVLRACRKKLASDPKDKLYGILGILPKETQKDFRADYSLSVKDIYTEVVDYIFKTTERMDVICDAIHFPVHISSASLPSFVPDWSYIPQVPAMGHKYKFSASGKTRASCKFLDDRLNKLEISGVYLDTIYVHGIAVGTHCTVSDYLMAFMHWRAMLLESIEDEKEDYWLLVQDGFCKTLSLNQVPQSCDRPNQWLTICYYLFASLLREQLPHFPMDRKLQDYINAKVDIRPEERRQFLQKHFGDQMMGRCFFRTAKGLVGMGSGLMLPGDVLIVPLGCSTPVLLREEGTRGEYRFVGDAYAHGYMYGRAFDELNVGKREARKYVLH